MLKQVVREDGSLYRRVCKGTDIDTTLEKVQEVLYRGRAINTCTGRVGHWGLGVGGEQNLGEDDSILPLPVLAGEHRATLTLPPPPPVGCRRGEPR